MENPTDWTPSEMPRTRPFDDMESGMLAGLWQVPLAGFQWTDAYKLLGSNGILDLDSEPSDPGPWLVARGAEARRYPLLRRTGLLAAMEQLAEVPTPERIVAFANKWGSLGIDKLLAPAERRAGGTTTITSGLMQSGESLTGWRTQLFAFADLRSLWHAASLVSQPESWSPSRVREANGDLNERIQWSETGICTYHSRFEAAGYWSEWHQHIYSPADRDATFVRTHLAGENTLEAARLHLHRRVNAEMRGSVSPAVLPYLGGVIRFFPASLLAAVWLRFAQELAGQAGRERECEQCRMPFRQRRRDQRFCGKNCQEASAYQRRRSTSTM